MIHEPSPGSQPPVITQEEPQPLSYVIPASSDISAGQPPAGDTLEQSLAFVQDVLDKQYFNYTWNDGKVQVLITTDNIIGAGAAAFVSLQKHLNLLAAVLLILSITCVTVSLILCLRHAIPRLVSGVSGPQNNLRAQTGITAQPNYTAYAQAVRKYYSRGFPMCDRVAT
jgi:hypothetical protein